MRSQGPAQTLPNYMSLWQTVVWGQWQTFQTIHGSHWGDFYFSVIASEAFIANSVYNESSFQPLRGERLGCFRMGREGLSSFVQQWWNLVLIRRHTASSAWEAGERGRQGEGHKPRCQSRASDLELKSEAGVRFIGSFAAKEWRASPGPGF